MMLPCLGVGGSSSSSVSSSNRSVSSSNRSVSSSNRSVSSSNRSVSSSNSSVSSSNRSVSSSSKSSVSSSSVSNSSLNKAGIKCTQDKVVTVLDMAAVPTTGAAGAAQVTAVPIQQGMQIMNVRPTQGSIIQPQQVRSLAPRMILNPQMLRPGQPGVLSGSPGHVLIKSDGQMHLVRLNPPTVAQAQGVAGVTVNNAVSSTTLPATSVHVTLNQLATSNNNAIVANHPYRFQPSQVTVVSSSGSNSTAAVPAASTVNSLTLNSLVSNVNTMNNSAHNLNNVSSIPSSSIINNSTNHTNTVVVASPVLSSALGNSVSGQQPQQQQQGVAAQSQPMGSQTISAESAKTKCKNFLATLLKLAGEQKQPVAKNVRNLIQGLIDSKVEPEAFTEELQKDLNSSPQPCLVPFLRKTLPFLRASLARGEISIEGVNPPPASSIPVQPGTTTVIPAAPVLRPPAPQQQIQHQQPHLQQQQQIRLANKTAVVNNNSVVGLRQPINTVNTVVVQQQQPSLHPVSSATAASTVVLPPSTAVNGSPATTSSPAPSSSLPNMNTRSAAAAAAAALQNNKNNNSKDRFKEKQHQSFAFNAADDDINDVAAMGGVNLGEESQRILDSTGFVGTQIRSCKDEVFLLQQPLAQRLKQICSKHDMDEPSKEFCALLSHAVQDRLKTIVEKLSVIAEHRIDIIKNEPRYEVLQDVKGQLRFLEDLDRLEKKRKDEVEREMLLRAAKSRNKNEDPEQAKLKAKAKEMQRVEMEEMRQRDANMAALKALQGPRKKAKLDGSEEMPLRQRTKRVNMRDLTFLMEQEKDLNKSNLLYRTYLK
ncbi:TAFH/NHR1 [Trinorchestia longiramus]|nr:TAFH/NHR1 [Trinorchestia longiramus]